MNNKVFSSNKPYLFRAILDWLLDNDATPYILVDVTKAHVEVPQEHVKDGQIVLNIKPSAVQQWQADHQAISFSARFSGVARQIYVPMNALMAIYAQENGEGMAFPVQETDELESPSNSDESSLDVLSASLQGQGMPDEDNDLNIEPSSSLKNSDKKVSHLRVVK